MTHLTYTIPHIIVGAEKPYVEALGRVAINLEDIEVKYSRTFNGFTTERKKILKRNLSHPLSNLAKKLGAIVYGGFENEKDFHLLMPTIEGLKVGDCNTYISSYGEEVRHLCKLSSIYVEIQNRLGFKLSTDHLKYKGNIFQEYARTGIIENELYKQFFK